MNVCVCVCVCINLDTELGAYVSVSIYITSFQNQIYITRSIPFWNLSKVYTTKFSVYLSSNIVNVQGTSMVCKRL